MNYANTLIIDGIETVITVLPLSMVPGFDPENPLPFTYTVPDEVQPGWEKQSGGAFAPPAPKPSAVPDAVTMRQARLALHGAGHLAQVNAAVAAMPGSEGEAARIEWEYASEVRRDSALAQAMAVMLDLDADALDALFIQASQL